ncbi:MULTISPECIES: COX15/CtaA family protein [Microbacterium]|uniref:Heme A synthase n=1 Tax=Microbacterium trichothecenolyticum TaxID=69370 RepID=A0A0M2HDT8_MICTR|nr:MULTISPECIES: COX15/CtaA family protein [Microbacterium]KJL42407.1 Heme A synthase [Microbacterium trichothecenolyticum]MDR7190154.1 cytochrome c oxidase assembly protein subunit 15 [Microbacterium sp. BE35]
MSAPQSTTTAPGIWQRFWQWLPDRVDKRIRVFAWLSFIAEVTIIGTGGAVRLTGSGLGCPTWPTCTPESLVPTQEMGIHGLIEFGNRTMTGLVGIIAAIVLVLVLKLRHERRDLYVLAVVVLGGVAAQAIVGGITVLTGLNPFIVGFHYVSSLALVCVTAAFLVRMSQPAGPRTLVVPRWHAVLAHVTTLAMALTIAFGVLTTGAGPHSGDADAGRNGFNAELLEHIHAWPGYALFALTVALVVAGWRARGAAPALLRWTVVLLGVELVQIAVGLYQARNGLPELAVGVHMVLAALAAAAMTTVVLHLKAPATQAVHS